MRAFAEDLTLALRFLRRRPAVNVFIVAVLGLGIGTAAAVFSLVNALLIRPLPFAQPERLMSVPLTVPPSSYRPGGGDNPWWSYPKLEIFRDLQRAFDRVAVYATRTVTVAGDGDAERITGELVNADYLATLGLRVAIGRSFAPDDDQRTPRQPVALLSDALWKRRYGADPAIVGRSIVLSGTPSVVIGILPQGFNGLTGRAEVFVPLLAFGGRDLVDPGSHFLEVVARRRTGVSSDQAQGEVTRLGAAIAGRYPAPGFDKLWGARAVRLDELRGGGGVSLWAVTLLSAVTLVLLIACGNVANLLLARGIVRESEFALRLALGASRGRLLRQLFAEALVLAVAGATLGLAVAVVVMRGIAAVAPEGIGRAGGPLSGYMATQAGGIALDGTVIALSAALAVAVACVFGILPGRRFGRVGLTNALKSGSNRGTSHGTGVLRGSLVTLQVALTLVLAVGAALVVRSTGKLAQVDAGVDIRNVLTFRVAPPSAAFQGDALVQYYDALMARVATIPGVEAVGAVDCPPVTGGCNVSEFMQPGAVIAFPTGKSVGVHFVTPGWADAAGLRVVRGRWFASTDRPDAPRVIVINEAAAKRYWPNENPIGRTAGVGMGGFDQGATIVGVVSDARFGSLDSLPRPDAYIPVQQATRGSMVIFAKTTVAPTSIVSAVRSAMRSIDQRVPMYDVQTMQARVDQSTARLRFGVVILSAFAAGGLLLAILGVYSVTLFTVARSTCEIGIRVALGATPSGVLRLVVGRQARAVAVGLVAGLLLSAPASRAIAGLLFGVSRFDGVVHAGTAATVLVVALVAALIPARRALRINPVVALASE